VAKKFILNADDLGKSHALNQAVLEGYTGGILKSSSLMANGEAFDEAINTVIPQCPDLGIGIHLNIIEGKALCSDVKTLTDEEGNFNNSFINLLVKAYSPKNQEFLADVEREFRVQIEKIMSKTKVYHIDSHVHVHAIPRIFEIACKLAKEYGIRQIRTQFEKPYIVPEIQKHTNLVYPVNLIKVALLNTFTLINDSTVREYELNTNDYLIGVTYTSIMDSKTIAYGLKAITNKDIVAEALIHPCRYEDGTIDNHFKEFLITKHQRLLEKINEMGYEITNYVQKES